MTRPAMTVDDLFASSSGAPIYFNQYSTVGDTVEGEVVEATAREKTVYRSNPPVIERWDDGNAKWQVVVTLQTKLRDRAIDNDDGRRRVFLRWYGTDKAAILEAVKAAGDPAIRVGAWMRVTYTGLGEAQPGLNAANVYAIEYRAASSVETLMTKDAGPQQAPPPPADRGSYAPSIPEQPGAISDARQTQLDEQARQASAQRSSAIGDRRELIAKATKLHAAGFSSSEISTMVPLSLEAIEAILG